MIRFEHTNVMNIENAIRGMRNPLESWDKSDSYSTHVENPQTGNVGAFQFFLGDADLALARKLAAAGSDHRKFLRQIFVSVDITAPLYWWKEYDTYKVGTVANSTSTMHKIHAKAFTLDDFSHEHLTFKWDDETQLVGYEEYSNAPGDVLDWIIDVLNHYREMFLNTSDKKYWWNMIQLLPSSYNQTRTCTMNYENIMNMYRARHEHKLTEWREFCAWAAELMYFRAICLGE